MKSVYLVFQVFSKNMEKYTAERLQFLTRFTQWLLFSAYIQSKNEVVSFCTLRKKSPNWVFSGPYFLAFVFNMEIYKVNLCIQSECGNIENRKTSVLGHISSSGILLRSYWIWEKTEKANLNELTKKPIFHVINGHSFSL